MVFSKAFPKNDVKTGYALWEKVFLSDREEKEVEIMARDEHNILFEQCLDDAKDILEEKGLRQFQSDIVRLACTLFEKRCSHVVYYKERLAKDKFENN